MLTIEKRRLPSLGNAGGLCLAAFVGTVGACNAAPTPVTAKKGPKPKTVPVKVASQKPAPKTTPLQMARINSQAPTNPILVEVEGKRLFPLDGFGPTFTVNGAEIGPAKYSVQVVQRETVPNGQRLTCRATAEGLSAIYQLTVTFPKPNRVELKLSSDATVSGVEPGKLQGADGPVKRFYTGEREAEAYEGGETNPQLVYIPTAKLYMRGAWDWDVSHAAADIHSVPVKPNFTVETPPIATGLGYTGGTVDGKPGAVPKLNERLILTFSPKLWEVYPPLPQKPSEYRAEMGKQVYIDLWDHRPAVQEGFMKWLYGSTKSQVPFLTIVQVWGERGFDGTLPDLFRIPDHMKQQNSTLEELKSLIDTAKPMGRAGLRVNYEPVTEFSWSLKEGKIRRSRNVEGNDNWNTDFATQMPLIERQESDIKSYFNDNARFSDQLTSGGEGGPYVQYQSGYAGRATLAGARAALKESAALIKKKVQGPLLSETMNGEFLTGQYVDSADFGIFAGHRRRDFSPEYKLRFLSPLAVMYSMGLGYRFYNSPDEESWVQKGFASYFNDTKAFDDYRACEVLYGNGGYIFWYPSYPKSRALSEVLMVGVAQPYYTTAPLDYVEYGKAGEWKQLPEIIAAANNRDDIHAWYQQFHVRYKNGCNVWINRKEENLNVKLPGGRPLTLPQYGWVVYTEDGNLLTYSALADDPIVPSNKQRIDFSEDKKRGLKYVDPRKPNGPIQGVTIPTLWLHGQKVYELTQDGPSFAE